MAGRIGKDLQREGGETIVELRELREAYKFVSRAREICEGRSPLLRKKRVEDNLKKAIIWINPIFDFFKGYNFKERNSLSVIFR